MDACTFRLHVLDELRSALAENNSPTSSEFQTPHPHVFSQEFQTLTCDKNTILLDGLKGLTVCNFLGYGYG